MVKGSELVSMLKNISSREMEHPFSEGNMNSQIKSNLVDLSQQQMSLFTINGTVMWFREENGEIHNFI